MKKLLLTIHISFFLCFAFTYDAFCIDLLRKKQNSKIEKHNSKKNNNVNKVNNKKSTVNITKTAQKTKNEKKIKNDMMHNNNNNDKLTNKNINDNNNQTKDDEKVAVNEKQIQNEQTNGVVSFLKKYIVPQQNPAFGSNNTAIKFMYGYDIDRLHSNDMHSRHLHVVSIDYSAPFTLFGLHARYSFGLFSIFGKDHAAISGGDYHHLGVEFYPEIILGNKNIYITFGCGVSYVVFGGPMTYESRHQAEASGIPNSGSVEQKVYDGMTYYNWILRASIGHRFDNGVSIELMWKHYSNGGLGMINYDINSFGITLSYSFSLKLLNN